MVTCGLPINLSPYSLKVVTDVIDYKGKLITKQTVQAKESYSMLEKFKAERGLE